jgi:hypothetical protein
MKIRRILVLLPLAFGVFMLGYSGRWFFLYLHRWEWNRALVSGLMFLAAEVGLFGAIALEMLSRLRKEVRAATAVATSASRQVRPDVLARIRESAPPPRNQFAWLQQQSGRTNVFIPILLGAGVIASGLAWVVERIARMTTGKRLEQDLAIRLGAFTLPEQLVDERTDRFSMFEPMPRNGFGAGLGAGLGATARETRP